MRPLLRNKDTFPFRLSDFSPIKKPFKYSGFLKEEEKMPYTDDGRNFSDQETGQPELYELNPNTAIYIIELFFRALAKGEKTRLIWL